MFNLDLVSGLAKGVNDFIAYRRLNEWTKLLLSLGGSYWLSSSFACGTALVAHRPTWEAIGEGLIVGSVMAVVVWRRSPLTRGLMLALPAGEANVEMETNTQVITK